MRGWKAPNSLLAFALSTPFVLKSVTLHCDRVAANEDVSVVEPLSKIAFPLLLANGSQLLGTGARQITFLKFNTYAAGIYASAADLKRIESKWDGNEDSFMKPANPLISDLLENSEEMTLRLVPARTSNGVHLRNAFEKLFTERLKKQSEIKDAERESILKSIREFASTFPNAQVSQKSEFLFIARDVREVLVKVDGKLRAKIESKWLAKELIRAYLEPEPLIPLMKLDVFRGLSRVFGDTSHPIQ